MLELTGFSNAADKLSEVIKDSLGLFIEPVKKIVMSEADLIIEKRKAKKQLEIDKINLVNRAKLRLFETEIQRQLNLETICQHAMNNLNEDSNPEELNKDWLNYFFSVSQDVSEEDLKLIWGKILAGESHLKGNFSKVTLDRLKVMSSSDCQLFEKLCKRMVTTESHALIIKPNLGLDFQSSYLYNFIDFLRMVDLGLISDSEIANIQIWPDDSLEISYSKSDIPQFMVISNTSGHNYKVECYLLTTSGKELMKLFTSDIDQNYFNNLLSSLKQAKLVLTFNSSSEIEILKLKRTEKLAEMSRLINSPAYARKNIDLDSPSLDTENSDISRYTLGEDSKNNPVIRSDNHFLHDNVD